MCTLDPVDRGSQRKRRSFMRLLGGGALSATLIPAFADDAHKAPKPENVLSPDAALDRLLKGNLRYTQGQTTQHNFTQERVALTGGQNPYAAILSCADSRVALEYAFDSTLGDLFVCRVAGNFANEDVIASFEYALTVLHTPLIMVLGHDTCGAVAATLQAEKSHETLPGHLPSLAHNIQPAVLKTASQPGDPLRNAVSENVSMNVLHLRESSPIIKPMVDDRKIRVVGAVYHLSDGKVELLNA